MSDHYPFRMSPRLAAIAEMVPQGDRLCDVGCDHAHVPVWLLKRGVIPSALAMDVIPGPLLKAKENLEMFGELSRVELRQSDGLNEYKEGEAKTLVISGMGGTLIQAILLRDRKKTQSFKTLILQPQSDPWLVREALRTLEFSINCEELVYDHGKYYPVMRAVKGQEQQHPVWEFEKAAEVPAKEKRIKTEDLFGPILLRDHNKTLLQFLKWRLQVMGKIMESLETARQKAIAVGEEEFFLSDPKIIRKKEEVAATTDYLKLALQLYDYKCSETAVDLSECTGISKEVRIHEID